jgi:hypothetical protein
MQTVSVIPARAVTPTPALVVHIQVRVVVLIPVREVGVIATLVVEERMAGIGLTQTASKKMLILIELFTFLKW